MIVYCIFVTHIIIYTLVMIVYLLKPSAKYKRQPKLKKFCNKSIDI
jgi:hypothetical protein